MHMTVRRRKLAALVACLVAPITAIPTLSENVAKHTGIAEASLRICGGDGSNRHLACPCDIEGVGASLVEVWCGVLYACWANELCVFK
jgi:hypothetical protein